MKTCKSCKESISAEASKCPKCQSYQNFWRHPLFWFFAIIPLIFIYLKLLSNQNQEQHNQRMDDMHADYADYVDKISLTVLSMDTLQYGKDKEQKSLNIIMELENKTKKKWRQVEYEVQFHSKEGTLVNVERQADYGLLRPHSSIKSSIKVPIYKEYADSEVSVNLNNIEPAW